MANYNEWDTCVDEYAGQMRMDLCAIGVGGILYPPQCAGEGWFDKENIMNLAENQDDLWLKYNEARDGIPVVYVKSIRNDVHMENIQETALSIENICGGENDRCIGRLNKFMKAYYPESYGRWISGLMHREAYILPRKSRCAEKIRDFLEAAGNKEIYLYGAGKRAAAILRLLDDLHLKHKIKAIMVSDKRNNPDVLEDVAVYPIDELGHIENAVVVYGVAAAYKEEIKNVLKKYRCSAADWDIEDIIRFY